MNKPSKPPYRPRRLFPRTLDEVVKHATKPLMDKQGKLYSALLRDWSKIVGSDRAAVTRPQRLQFPANDPSGATLHLDVRPAAAPELAYVTEQMLEQCARYFGYRAISRIVIHATHGAFDAPPSPKSTTPTKKSSVASADLSTDMQEVLNRIGAHLGSTVVKKD